MSGFRHLDLPEPSDTITGGTVTFCGREDCADSIGRGSRWGLCLFHHYERATSAAVTYDDRFAVWPVLRLLLLRGDGSLHDVNERTIQAITRARRRGGFTEEVADRLCCDLGLHPFSVYGLKWFTRDGDSFDLCDLEASA